MQDQDTTKKGYWDNDERLADLINVGLLKGEPWVKPEDIEEVDSSSYGMVKWFDRYETEQKYRDIIRKVRLGVRFAFIGIENQELVHFAMPVRTMGYDFLGYDRQVKRIKQRHRRRKDLRGNAEFLSGFTQADLLVPVVTTVLYYGDEPWNGPRSLKEMMRLEDFPESLRELVNDYPLHIIDVKRFAHSEQFKTDLRLVFGILQRHLDNERLDEFLQANENDFQSMEDDAYIMVANMTHTEELMKFRSKNLKGGKVDMCQAIADMKQKAKNEGILEGKIEGKMNCYLNAILHGLSHEDALAIADITEEEAESARSLRKEGKL